MIIWLPSYPKSGNTFLRALISSYFLTEDGNYSESALTKINQFPSVYLYRKYGFDTSCDEAFIKNAINVQIKMNTVSGKKLRFLKTHSCLKDINGYKFTDLKNTLGAIYIVRDPRIIIKSFANHFQRSFEESANILTQLLKLSDKDKENFSKYKRRMLVTHVGTWSMHYQSWKFLKNFDKYLLLKYEDLVNNTEESFIRIIDFISKLCGSKIDLDHVKLEKVIKSTSFRNMQKIEREKGFTESPQAGTKGKKVTFFKYGIKNDLNEIPKHLKKKIENEFENELKELNYI